MFNLNLPYKLEQISARKVYGRYLYKIIQHQNVFYLKCQQPIHTVFEQGWQNEKNIYQQFDGASFLLPAQYVTLEEQGLVLPEAEPIFIQPLTPYLIKELLDVLGQLHQTGWIHGDLKPQHFVRYQNTVRLIDFEHTCQANSIQPQLHATPRYMAPELFHGEPKSIQSDLYALGIILYEHITQTRLNAQTYQDWAILHCQMSFQIPKQFNKVLTGLLKKQKQNRFKDIQAVIDCLES